jgi:hypothetical protein
MFDLFDSIFPYCGLYFSVGDYYDKYRLDDISAKKMFFTAKIAKKISKRRKELKSLFCEALCYQLCLLCGLSSLLQQKRHHE